MKLTALLIIFFLGYGRTFSQVIDSFSIHQNYNSMYKEKHLSILASIGMQRVGLAEIGIAINEFMRNGHHGGTLAYFLSSEILLGRHPMIGPKIGGWLAGGSSAFAMGADMIYYTDFKNSAVMLKAKIGGGFHNFAIVYGYSIALTNSLDYLSRHSVTYSMLFSLKQLSSEYKVFD